jgi:crotonobetainyl-CoA:carnitine CoA-transferase CaiB-like acyl-CoA transferase
MTVLKETTLIGSGSPTDAVTPGSRWAPFSLLEGVRVIDLTDSIAGPYATLMLADLGAEVAKVEWAPDGGGAHWGRESIDGASLWFSSINRNKASVALDLETQDGAGHLARLVRGADVIVTSLPAALQNSYGVDYGQAFCIRQDIIHCTVVRPDPQAPAPIVSNGRPSDALAPGAETPSPGLPALTAPEGELLAGADAAYAVVAALLDRQRTGHGHEIRISSIGSMARFMGPHIVPDRSEDGRRLGEGPDATGLIHHRFETATDPIVIGFSSDAEFRRVCVAIERPAWSDVPAFETNRSRSFYRLDLIEMIQDVLLRRTAQDWVRVFVEHGIPVEPLRLSDLSANPGVQGQGLFYQVRTASGALISQVGTGWWLDGTPNGRAAPPVGFGADTERILKGWSGSRHPTAATEP